MGYEVLFRSTAVPIFSIEEKHLNKEHVKRWATDHMTKYRRIYLEQTFSAQSPNQIVHRKYFTQYLHFLCFTFINLMLTKKFVLPKDQFKRDRWLWGMFVSIISFIERDHTLSFCWFAKIIQSQAMNSFVSMLLISFFHFLALFSFCSCKFDEFVIIS